jgi:hypothetical protein
MGFYSRALMSSAPDEPPENTASMSLSVLQVPQQAGGPLVSSYQYSQTRSMIV